MGPLAPPLLDTPESVLSEIQDQISGIHLLNQDLIAQESLIGAIKYPSRTLKASNFR